jgi:hypothetical protein
MRFDAFVQHFKTLAATPHKSRSVEDRDRPAMVLDETIFLQFGGCNRDCRPSDT